MTKKAYKFRNNQLVEDEDGFLREGESYRVPLMICDSAGGQQPMLDALADRAADPQLSPADRVAARDALHQQYAALAATPLYVHRNPGLFDEATREALLVAPAAAGRDKMEAVYAAYDAHVRDAWRNGQAPEAPVADRKSLDAVYSEYEAHVRDAWKAR